MNQTLNVFFRIFALSMAALVCAYFCLLPYWSSPGFLFAVTVPAGFRKTREGRRIVRDYRLQACAHAFVSFGLLYVGAWTDRLGFLLLGIFWLPAGYFLAYQWAQDRVTPYAVALSRFPESALEPREARFPGGWPFQLGPFAILISTAFFLHSRWRRLPFRFPFREGFRGRPPGFIGFPIFTRDGVYGPLILAGLLCAVLWLWSYRVLWRARRAPSGGGNIGRERESLHRNLSVVVGSEYLLAAIFSAAGELVPFLGPLAIVPLGVLAIVAIAALFLLTAESQHEVLE
jgi:hypothetical protein